MIWVAITALLAFALLVIIPPLFRLPDDDDTKERALAEARAQRLILETEQEAGAGNSEAADEALLALDRRILKLIDDDMSAKPVSESASSLVRLARFGLPALLVAGGLGLYLAVGSPLYRPVPTSVAENGSAPVPPRDAVERMVLELETRIQTSASPSVRDLVLLARAYMSLERYDDGLALYEAILARTGSDPLIVSELESAREFVIRRRGVAAPSVPARDGRAPGLDKETVEQFASLSAEERNATIMAMINGLADRLEDDPADLDGWKRLIRARTILGNTKAASSDLAKARLAFKDDTNALDDLERLRVSLGIAAKPQSSD